MNKQVLRILEIYIYIKGFNIGFVEILTNELKFFKNHALRSSHASGPALH